MFVQGLEAVVRKDVNGGKGELEGFPVLNPKTLRGVGRKTRLNLTTIS